MTLDSVIVNDITLGRLSTNYPNGFKVIHVRWTRSPVDFEILSTCKAGICWIKDHFEAGATIDAICAGTFFLAETGLLDGRAQPLTGG